MPWMFKKTKRLLLPISSVAFVVSLVALVLAIILGNKNPDKPVTNLKYNDIMQIVGKVCYSTAQNDSLLAQEADVTPSMCSLNTVYNNIAVSFNLRPGADWLYGHLG
ncbi:hypothetical protein BgiMline_032929 [Biomphalaria glabrata]|nr:hypothetical protein BgiMline_015930 [Biomphalaria glabrata]